MKLIRIFITLLLLITIFGVFNESKADNDSHFSSRIKAGLTVSSLSGDTLDSQTLVRPVLGMKGIYNYNPQINLSGGIQYSIKGSKREGGTIRNVFHSLDFPFSLEYKLFDVLNLYAGIQPSLFVYGGKYHHERSSGLLDYEPFEHARLYDISYLAGMEIPLFDKVSLGVRYAKSLQSINPGDDADLFHRGFEFSLILDISRDDIANVFVREKDTLARHHILQMRQGAVLIRLPTRQQTIDRLEEMHEYEQAERVKRENEEQKARIINAFKNEFNFAPVFFFESQYSNEIRGENFENVFSADGEEYEIEEFLSNRPYYILEFTDVQRPGAGRVFEGLVVHNKYFHALEHPFPFYVREIELRTQTPRSHLEMVRALNEELFRYYYQVSRSSN